MDVILFLFLLFKLNRFFGSKMGKNNFLSIIRPLLCPIMGAITVFLHKKIPIWSQNNPHKWPLNSKIDYMISKNCIKYIYYYLIFARPLDYFLITIS